MTSRDRILATVAKNQPPLHPLPEWETVPATGAGNEAAFTSVLETIGGHVHSMHSLAEVNEYITGNFAANGRVFSMVTGVHGATERATSSKGHSFENVELAVLWGRFGVAENGAVWITEDLMGDRAVPFICQHLAVLLPAGAVVATMHEAYAAIGSTVTGFGTFIAGPSKTADIEQSLVLGAHGPKTMTVFLLHHSQSLNPQTGWEG